jgi:hypothetical protein
MRERGKITEDKFRLTHKGAAVFIAFIGLILLHKKTVYRIIIKNT